MYPINYAKIHNNFKYIRYSTWKYQAYNAIIYVYWYALNNKKHINIIKQSVMNAINSNRTVNCNMLKDYVANTL